MIGYHLQKSRDINKYNEVNILLYILKKKYRLMFFPSLSFEYCMKKNIKFDIMQAVSHIKSGKER